MDKCPTCDETLHDAIVVCAHCGQTLPLQVVVVSEGSHGGGFALAKNMDELNEPILVEQEEVDDQ